MDSTRYTITELLTIRGSKLQTSLEQKLLDGAKDNPVLTDILRQKHLGRHRRFPYLSRNNMEIRKSSSGDLEGRESIKPQAPQGIALLRDQAVRQTIRHPAGDVSQLDGQAGRQLDGQDAEPDSLPEAPPQRPVLPDQKRKGFEQFYEAVRSPTHVRVTAGGRIVPNTLEASHVSPTGKGSRERFAGDVNGTQPPLGQAFNGNPFLPGPPLMGPMHPAMHSAFSMITTGPGPMPPFGGFAMPPFAVSQVPSQTAFSHLSGGANQAGNPEDKKEHETGAAPTVPSMPMPPLGGQWFLPPHPMMPLGMQFPGGPMMPMAFSPMGQSMLYQQPPQPVPATGTKSFTSAAQAESCPISSIRPSIITKNQLAGLRSSLKKAEAQLAYNRHQIDEKHMEEYARQLRSDIEHFEIKLKGELALEDNTLPQRNDTKEKSDPNVSKEPKSATDSRKRLFFSKADAENKNEPAWDAPAKTTEEHKASRSRKKDQVKLAVDTSMASAPFINSNMIASISPVSFDPTRHQQQQQQQQESDHVRKPSTGLPVSAARAPVFQPRLDLRHASENTPPVSAAINGENDTRGTRFHGPIPTNLEESRLLSSIAPPTPAHDIEEFSKFARDNAGLGLPYLVGEVPFGMDPSPDLKDYIYHRPLNQDEEMAKHLFWTDAPEHLRQKFPKFDGKDFYPISPEKKPRPRMVTSNLPTGRPEQDYGFTLPTADLDPFAPLEPYREETFGKPTFKEREGKDIKRDTKSDNVTSPMKRRNKLRPVAYFNSQGLDESKQSSGSSENVVESESERAYFNSCVRTWSERVTAAATALPGAVTPENAHGYLPQYAIGHAAASLSPAIAKVANQSTRLSPSKLSEEGHMNAGLSLLTASADGRVENRPPSRFAQTK
ncbi:uncharacterized protein ColSpa_07338 [Colletotrichum spaethianum]|uniref:Uncharacterized protein n=1 Tax=Colletotrichum spaethianum TaxID=700344 RepID=A0AA37LLY0_9PEZI|nr:uncharacterized protein ColSpa_07338 [Colletotrichum spaethianum]GKT47157.1 hypothetical protein ColSpa_07338 [Colletotrichum spaethianum]